MLIVKTPEINGLGKTNGCGKAGELVISGLDEIHSSERNKPIDRKLLDLKEINADKNNLEEQNQIIYENSLKIFQEQERTVFLGGDHSISFSIGKAFLDYCRQDKENQKPPCLIVFDAHADCMAPMKEPTHEEWLRALMEYGFPAENILLVGARNLWKSEIEFLSRRKIKRISMNELNNDLEEITDAIMEFASGKELYVSLDIDVIDPAFAPATGYPEPGGLSGRQMIYIFSRLSRIKNLKAVDLVEINPEKKGTEQTIKLGSRLLAELL